MSESGQGAEATGETRPGPALPHGGRLVEQFHESFEREADYPAFARLPAIPIDDQQVLDAEKIANGTFSPLTGFMGPEDYQSVLDDLRLADGLPFSIPVVLSFPGDPDPSLRPPATALLWNRRENAPAAVMEVESRFQIDPEEQARKVYGTTDANHPGVSRLYRAGRHCLSGPVRLLRRSKSLMPAAYDRSPAEVRREFANRGWRTITGFQTRNLGHRAHEKLQKFGLELTDGLLIHPLIGWKKRGDMLPETILDGYEILIRHYYPRGRVLLSGLSTAMRYAGPREAVFHAIIRKNFGCTHFIVGRDHAGVGGYYDKYAAHRIFDAFSPGELGITILRLHGPAYCEVCDEIVTEATCPHGPGAHVDISGTDVRAMISRGERPDAKLMRPEIADFLIERSRTGRVFFEE